MIKSNLLEIILSVNILGILYRLLKTSKKLESVYNPKEHEDYTFVKPYKIQEDTHILNGKYRDPEPIYGPKHPKKKYSDHDLLWEHNLENYRLNKHQGIIYISKR